MENIKRKNCIWIVADQLRQFALSINGDPNIQTPNIDRLAINGMNFTNAISGYPLCCPFRGSMLTSQYPHKCVKGHEYQMPSQMPTIADVFNENDYYTAYFGKWHVDGFKESTGRAAFHVVDESRRGNFKYWLGYENNNSQFDSYVHGTDIKDPKRLKGYETDALTDIFLDHISSHVNKKDYNPFFMVLSVQPPHNPYVAPSKYMDKYNPQNIKLRGNVPLNVEETAKYRQDLAGYYACIKNLDDNVGKVLEKLTSLGIDKDTHIIFFSDHGDMHGSHGLYHKTNPYEESIRIPFIIGGEKKRYNDCINGNTDVLINHIDIAPTTLGLCGIDKPSWMKGQDFSGYRLSSREKVSKPKSTFIQSVVPTGHGNSIDKAWRAVVTDDGYKLACFENSHWLLFDLNNDPLELINLAHNPLYHEKRNYLTNLLKEHIQNSDDNFMLP